MKEISQKYWHMLDNGKIQCDLCPRFCKLTSGQKGFCFVRQRLDDKMVLYTYGKTSGIGIDPIEKKPLNHFLPTSKSLSFGTAGCNLACKFCQNWDISKSQEIDMISQKASPHELVALALKHNCKSISFTYNDPVIFLEYAQDVALLAHQNGLKTVAVTAGYINPGPREDFFSFVDGANIDLKAFSEDFYKEYTGAHLENILDTLLYVRKKTNVWLEITNLVIPETNDSKEDINQMTKWIAKNLGGEVPIHFSAFHPDWKMQELHRTPSSTLNAAREIAMKNGLKYVYTGNVHNKEGASTFCPNCKNLLIERDWYDVKIVGLKRDKCSKCQTKISGRF